MIRILAFIISILVPSSAFAQMGITPCTPAASISVSNSSNNTQLSVCGDTVILYNITSTEAFYAYGAASNTAATTSSFSLPGNSFIVLNLGSSPLYLAAITASSTTTIRIVQGRAR